MNSYRKRIDTLSRKQKERMCVPVVIADLTESGKYVWKGHAYSKKEFNQLMDKVRPCAIIVDNIPRLAT